MTRYQSPNSQQNEHAGARAPKRVTSLLVFAGCSSLAIALVFLGYALIKGGSEASQATVSKQPISVAVQPVMLEPGYEHFSQYTGLVEPVQQTNVAFENGGTLAEVYVQEGQRVRRNDAIARLDTRLLQADRSAQLAQRDALTSDLERAELALKRLESLQTRDFADGQSVDDARLQVDRSNALIRQVDAAINAIDIALDKAVIRAPFDAQVGAQEPDKGSIVTPGMTIAQLYEWSATALRVGLPIDLAQSLNEETAYTVMINDVKYPARLLSRRHDVSSLTRTVGIRLLLETRGLPALVFGQTAQFNFTQWVGVNGYRVPVSSLSEGENGLWSLMLVSSGEGGSDEFGSVTRVHVTLLHTDGVTAFVQGDLPPDAFIIKSAPHRVVAGQHVATIR